MRARGSSSSGASAIYPGTPQVANLQAAPTNNIDATGFNTFTQDNRVRGAGYLTQSAPLVNDWVGFLFTLGPKGSIWGLRWSAAVAPNAGKLSFDIASVAEPDPNRAGVSDTGTLLRSDDLTFHAWGSTFDTYAAAFADSEGGGQTVIRLMGDDHAPLTTIGASFDPWTGFAETDGGAGVYRVRAKVTSKNAASTGFKLYLTALALVRLDDNGFM